MLREIGNLAAVMKTWGHKHVRTTMRYQHPELDIVRDGLRRLNCGGKTQITDRSLEILGGMSALESLEFWECKGVTDAGLVFLAALPRLREVTLHGLPHVTLEGTAVFPAHVRVDYSV